MRIPALPRDALDTADRAPPISRGKRNSNHSSKSTEARLGNEGNGGLPENNKAASNTVTLDQNINMYIIERTIGC